MIYILNIIITNENRVEAKVNIVQYQQKKLDILVLTEPIELSDLSSTSTGFSPKIFVKSPHPILRFNMLFSHPAPFVGI